MNKKTLLAAAILLLLVTVVIVHRHMMDRGARTTAPEYTDLARVANGNELVSGHDPAVTLRFAPEFRHIGGQKFILYGVANTEQHFFVEESADGKLKSLYWIQYEAYLPGKRYRYDYEDSPLRMQLGDYDFYVDTAVVKSDPAKRRKGTDGALARAFSRRQGYEFPEHFAYARLVHLPDEERRKELMIIFIEDLAPQGLAAPSLKPGGENHDRWPAVEKAHLDKIRSTLAVLPND